jgi:glycosyltransferase involved in cell wall biosynthesis
MGKNSSVCLFIDTFHPGGAERVCINYANELVKLGFNVHIIAYNNRKQFYVNELDNAVEVRYLDVNDGMAAFLTLLTDGKDILNFNSIVAFNHQIALILYIIKKLKNKNYRLIARNVNNISKDLLATKSSYIKNKITNIMMRYFYHKIEYYIAQCDSMKSDMINTFNIPEERITVIQNPVASKFKKISKEKDIDILFIGRLKKQKGLDNLVKIMSFLSSKGKKYNITIVGEGELRDYLINSLEDIGVDYNYIKNTNDTVDLYNRSKCCILTSYYEGYPNVLVESLACGTPVISFDCVSGPSEIIDDGRNGYLIECFNHELFSRKIEEIVTNGLELEEENNNEKEINKLKPILNLQK